MFNSGYMTIMASSFGISSNTMILVLIWAMIWKGLGLWKAARSESKGWFVAFLLIHTLGILEILYIYVFSNKKKGKRKK